MKGRGVPVDFFAGAHYNVEDKNRPEAARAGERNMAIIGIDLGTTNSLAAVWRNGKSELIPNGLGEYLTPSVVSVDDDGSILVGAAARDRLISHPKVAFVGSNELAKTTLFQILMGEMEPDEGVYKWGITTSQSYFPLDFGNEFDNDYTIVEWLTQYSEEKDVTYVRGFLGRMLFGGDDGVKRVSVLSGGEKVRCMLSKMMISGSNILVLNEPTNHLDMESITALNNGMTKFPGVLLFSSTDHQIVQTTANRIMEIVPGGKLIDKITTYDEYLENDEMARKRQTYTIQKEEDD